MPFGRHKLYRDVSPAFTAVRFAVRHGHADDPGNGPPRFVLSN